MTYQTPRYDFSGIKTFGQWVVIFIAFVAIPAVGLDQWITEEMAQIKPTPAALSNAVVIDGVTYNKHGRVQP